QVALIGNGLNTLFWTDNLPLQSLLLFLGRFDYSSKSAYAAMASFQDKILMILISGGDSALENNPNY
ncbi:hypothetical protein ACJX0J_023984, partial [Zea mays]